MLDVMHYEKNVCENMLKTIFGEKDIVVVRRDMQEASIRPKLWLLQIPNGSYIKPMAPYVMTKQEKKALLQIIKNLKVHLAMLQPCETRLKNI
jgi:hypothetical protein